MGRCSGNPVALPTGRTSADSFWRIDRSGSTRFGARANCGGKVSKKKITWVSHPLLAAASEQIEKGQLDDAESNLKKLLQEKPDSVEAYRMLQNIYFRKDRPASSSWRPGNDHGI